MDATAAIAGYAAVVSTAALGWQIYSTARASGTRIRVKVTVGLPVQGPMVGQQILMITVYNHSGQEVQLESAGFELLDGTKRTSPIMWRPNGATIPGSLTPRTNGQTWTDLGKFRAALGRTTNVRAYADDAAGNRHVSKKFTIT
jgi:hypothetical protein